MLFPIAFFPPVEYFALLARCGQGALLDDGEKYQKQSYRNRCRILSANGSLDFNVPIVHNGLHAISEVRVDWSTPWLDRFEYAVDSAYYSSPFFIYYRDELFSILDSHPETLWELDFRVLDFFCRKLGISTPKLLGNHSDEDILRERISGLPYQIHPKRTPISGVRPYWQVFREKFGFVPNLSIMDLLFNEGTESLGYLL